MEERLAGQRLTSKVARRTKADGSRVLKLFCVHA